MRRRDLIPLLGGAAMWPLAARAQQPTMPGIGYLSLGSRESDDAHRLIGLRHGLSDSGYVQGRNFTVEYRWAGGQLDRLPALAAESSTNPPSGSEPPRKVKRRIKNRGRERAKNFGTLTPSAGRARKGARRRGPKEAGARPIPVRASTTTAAIPRETVRTTIKAVAPERATISADDAHIEKAMREALAP